MQSVIFMLFLLIFKTKNMDIFQHSLFIPIITMIASLATFAYAVIAFRTLFEMKKQREASYKPELIAIETLYHLEWRKNYIYSAEKDKEILKEGKKLDVESYKIKIYNIGLGTAKGVNITFDFPYIEAIEIIKKMYEEINVDFNHKLEYKKNEHGRFVFYADRAEYHFSDYIEKFDFLMPVSQEKTFGQFHIPPCIEHILLLYNNASNKYLSANEGNLPENEFPKLTLNMLYKDIANKEYRKKVKLSFDIRVSSTDSVRGHIIPE